MALENELPPALLSSEFMTDVHLFSGTNEFAKNNMKQKKFDETVNTFRDSFFEDMLSEYPLHFFSKWYKTINEFSTVLENLKYMEDAGTSVVWDYRLLVLNPLANPNTTSNKKRAKKWSGPALWQLIS
jgi:hypothetical protein